MDPSADPRREAAALHEEALSRRDQGNASGALARYHRCLALVRQLGDDAWQARLEAEIGDVHYEQYELDDALHWLRTALATCERLGDDAGAGRALLRIGQALHLQGNLAAAAEPLQQAEARLHRARDTEALRRLAAARAALDEETRRDEEERVGG